VTNTVYRTDEPRKRMVRILKEAQERYAHALLGIDERELLRDRIIGLKIKLAKSAS
jgi:hypothetical protein